MKESFECRNCKSQLEDVFINLGNMPSANSFLQKNELKTEKIFPLCVYICRECYLVQIPEIRTPEELFSNYAYFSSYSDSWLKHSEIFTDMMIKRFNLKDSSFIIEIASNDGYLLEFFSKHKIPVLGIEPASNVAEISLKKGIPTMTEFFSTKLANELKNQRKADVLIGNNVLAHVPNLNDFIQGMKILLNSNGVISIEVPHLLQLIRQNQFDTIYHEHFSYFSFFVIEQIFRSHGLTIFDVEELSTHGGSLRIFAKHTENDMHKKTSNVEKILQKEREFGLDKISTYVDFSKKAEDIKCKLNIFLKQAYNEKKLVVCYGAPAKGNTLLNYCKINTKHIDYTVDLNQFKQGFFLPGTHLEIKDPLIINNTKPDYVIILPWNIKDEIMEQLSFIKNWGGRFVIPIPEVIVI